MNLKTNLSYDTMGNLPGVMNSARTGATSVLVLS